jgi:hypothetical protein
MKVFGKTVIESSLIEWILNDLGLKYEQKDVDMILRTAMNEIDMRARRGEHRFPLLQEFDDLCRKIMLERV